MIAHRDKTKTRWRWFVGIALAALAFEINLVHFSQAAELASASALFQQIDASTFRYNIDLKDTGTTAIGTLWYAWVPGADFLGSSPTNLVSPPAGRRRLLTKASTTALPSSGSTALVRYSRVRRYSVLSSTSLPRRQVCRATRPCFPPLPSALRFFMPRALERRGSPVQHRSHESSLAESVCVPGRG